MRTTMHRRTHGSGRATRRRTVAAATVAVSAAVSAPVLGVTSGTAAASPLPAQTALTGRWHRADRPLSYVARPITYAPAGLTTSQVDVQIAGMSTSGIIAGNATTREAFRSFPFLEMPHGRVLPLAQAGTPGCISHVVDVNSAGTAVGTVGCHENGSWVMHQVQWKRPNRPVILPGRYFEPEQIGDGGEVIGRVLRTDKGGRSYPALRTRSGEVVVGSTDSWAMDVDASGTVVGWVDSTAALGRRTPDLTGVAGAPQNSSIVRTSPDGRRRVGYVVGTDGSAHWMMLDRRGRATDMAGTPTTTTFWPLGATDRGAVVFRNSEDGSISVWRHGRLRSTVIDTGGHRMDFPDLVASDKRLTVAVSAYDGQGRVGYRLVPAWW